MELRRWSFEERVIVSRKMPDAVDQQLKFKMYYDCREPVKRIPSHRMLAIRRLPMRLRSAWRRTPLGGPL
jgi:uncharacterized protein